MRAMILRQPGTRLEEVDLPRLQPGPGQVRVKVRACAVCRTDLHVVDGDLTDPKLPVIPGHEIVGEVVESGPGVRRHSVGDRVGIPWLGWTCGRCAYCRSGRENLCSEARFTGYTLNGGYAEEVVAYERYCFPMPQEYSDVGAAPLLCAGLIGYRSLVMAGPGRHLGLYGFGAAAHIVAQVARHQGRSVYAFTRPGDRTAQDFALSLGAVWAGGSQRMPPQPLDAAIIFAPVGPLVPLALEAVGKGGTVVLGGIHMSDIPSFPYRLLWEERRLCSVANLTRKDAIEFLEVAPRVPVRTETVEFPLNEANEALRRLKQGELDGAAVLVP